MLSYVARFLIVTLFVAHVEAFSMSASKEIYGVPGSGWRSPHWNWGSAEGTGHECAAICRNQYATEESRVQLVQSLLEPSPNQDSRVPPFEEVKLVLALAWQRGRWDRSTWFSPGYVEVLSNLAAATKYEFGSEEDCSKRLIYDMAERFELLNPSAEELQLMQQLENVPDFDAARRVCSGLVLNRMGFVQNGL